MYIVYYCWVRQTTIPTILYYLLHYPPLPSPPLPSPLLPSPPLPVQEYASVLRGRWSWETSVWSQRSAQSSGSVCSQWSRGPVVDASPPGPTTAPLASASSSTMEDALATTTVSVPNQSVTMCVVSGRYMYTHVLAVFPLKGERGAGGPPPFHQANN